MYNLIMVGAADMWNGEPCEFDKSRILEYTSETLKKPFEHLDDSAFKELARFPALFAYEVPTGGVARVGWITRILPRGRQARIEYSFAPELPEIPMERIADLVWELDIQTWEVNRTHWALKDIDLFPVLVRGGLITQPQVDALISIARSEGKIPQNDPPTTVKPTVVKPTVFRIPDGNQEPDLVSVMIPFSDTFEPVFQQIKTSCLGRWQCQRVKDVWTESEIIQEIFSLIFRSRVVICDFSGKNSNVFYEAGIAHTLGRAVIPIVQEEEDIPFDLRHHRYIKYDNSSDGLRNLSLQLTERLETLLRSVP
ncbi:MAG: hypothetical protein H7829_02330 [Magnetococcus sp. THC-1_WYH]